MSKPSPTSKKFSERFAPVIRHLKQNRRYLALGGVSIVLANGLLLYTPKLHGQVVDGIEAGIPLSQLADIIWLMLGLTLLSGIFRFFMRRTIIWMARWIEFNLRGELFDHLLRLSPGFYHNHRTGDIMARITNDLDAIRLMVGPGVMYAANALVSLVIGLSLMVQLSPKMTMYALIPLFGMPIIVYRIGGLLHRRQAQIQKQFGRLTAAAQENLSGMRVVKAYAQEAAETEHFSSLSQKYTRLNLKLAKIQGIFVPLMRLVAAFSYLTVLYVGGLAVIRHEVPLGTMVAFFGYLALLTWPIIAVGWVVSLFQRGAASLDRINQLLQTQPEVQDNSQLTNTGAMQGKIEFRQLRFGYRQNDVLRGIDLTVLPGQTVGIIGPTGSGKTTLVHLLTRLFPVARGQLFIDDLDINDWPLGALRKQIGLAPQEPLLFSDTVGRNIGFGQPEATREEIARVSRIASLEKDIQQFAQKYDTIVGERGITLSGGQKQRCAIARALLVDPTILIFDDATSAVDTETEHEIGQRIKSVLSNRTALIISHRVSSVKDADIICYLERGVIIEQGDHNTLIDKDGAYAKLYRAQLLEQKLEQL